MSNVEWALLALGLLIGYLIGYARGHYKALNSVWDFMDAYESLKESLSLKTEDEKP